MKKVLKESFEWKVAKNPKKDGGFYYIAYIDQNESTDSVYNVRDVPKKYGARFDGVNKRWYFVLSSNDAIRNSQIEKYVKPCVEELQKRETIHNGKSGEDIIKGIIAQIDQVINSIDSQPSQQPSQGPAQPQIGKEDIKSKLMAYKQELINSFRDNTFREKMGPIIKFRQAQGAGYSILNSILIMLQKPDAKMVKSVSKWRKANKSIKPGAKPIFMWVPLGSKVYSPEEQKEIEADFLKKASRRYGKELKSRNELQIGDREILEKQLNATQATSFELKPNFYDISDTAQIPGTEDMVGSVEGGDDIEWFDKTSPADEKTTQLYDSLIKFIESIGINIKYSSEEALGGARGLSRGGEIEVIENAPKDPGTVSTLIHELSHEMLHHKYLSTKGGKNEDFSQYFIGRPDGKKMVEQQAEISAWIVMRNFGYDMKSAKNYVACWGGDDATSAYAFDSVASTATRIIKGINENMGIMSEGIENGMQNEITGLDVASMIGPEFVEKYKRGKRELNIGQIQEQFKTMLDKITPKYDEGEE